MPSPSKSKTRKPLAELPNAPALPASRMSQGGKDTGLKRAAKDYDGAAPGSSSYLPAEKKRRASKRVSFGGEHVKLFDSNASINSDDYIDRAESSTKNDHFAEASQSNRSPLPRGINRHNAINSFDDVGEDTLTLPKSPKSSYPNPSAPLAAKNIVNMGQFQSSRYSLDPNRSRTSGVYSAFVDDEISRGVSPSLSTSGLADETMTLHGRPSTELPSPHPRESISSEEDITLQIPDHLVIDDDYGTEAQAAHHELSARSSASRMDRHSFDGGFPGMESNAVEDLPGMVATDFADDLPSNPADFDGFSAPPLAPSSGSKPAKKLQLRQEPRSVPRTLPSPSKRLPRQSLPENRKLFSNENDDEDTTIHFHDHQVQDTKKTQKPTSILKKTKYPQPLSLEQEDVPENNALQSPEDRTVKQLGHQTQSTPQSVLGSKIRAAALERSASKKLEDTSVTIEHSVTIGAADERPNHYNSVKDEVLPQKVSVASFLDAVGIHFKGCDELPIVLPMSNPNASLIRGIQLANSEDRNTLSGQIVSCLTKKAVLNELESARSSLTELAASVRNHVQNISNDIEHSAPPIFAKVCNSSDMAPEEISVIQTGLKRLRRIANMQSRLHWVQSRQTRERRMADMLKSSIESLERDAQRMITDETQCMSYKDSLSSQMANLDLGDVSMNSTELCRADERQNLIDLWGSYKGEVQALLGYKNRTKENLKKLEELRKTKSALAAKLVEARRNLSAGSTSMLEALLQKKTNIKKTHSFLSGILPLKVCAAHMDVRVAGYADVRFSLSGDSVDSVKVHSLVGADGRIHPAVPSFINDAISKCAESCLNNVLMLNQIPLVLHLARAYLTCVKQCCRDALHYLDEHEQDSEFLKTSSSDSPSADLVLGPNYFSVRKRCNFDVALTRHHFPPQFNGSTVQFKDFVASVSVTSVCPIIGEAPSLKDIEDIIHLHNGEGQGHLSKYIGVRQNMEAIWRLLRSP